MEGIDDLARFYLWFLDVMGLGRVHLLGHSIGGWTAAEMATMRPDVIDRLVLVAPTGLKPEVGEILDIFYYPPEELFKHTVFDASTIPERERLFGRPPTPGGGGDRPPQPGDGRAPHLEALHVQPAAAPLPAAGDRAHARALGPRGRDRPA